MADLPMAQIPNFQLPGPSPVNAQPGFAQGVASGVPSGIGTVAQMGQMKAMMAMREAQIQQMNVEKNMHLLDKGLDLIIDGGPSASGLGNNLIKGPIKFLTGQDLPDGASMDRDDAKDLNYWLEQHQKFQETGGKEGLSAKDAVTGATQALQQFGVKYRTAQEGILEKTPMYSEATANLEPGVSGTGQPTAFNPKSGQTTTPGGQPTGAGFTPASTAASIGAENVRNAKSSFSSASEGFSNLANNFSSFNYLMQPSRSGAPKNPEEVQAQNTAEKTAFLNYMQMVFSGSKRPANFESIEDLEKAGSLSTLASQAFNKLSKGDILTPKQIKGISQTALDLYQSKEQMQTQLEQSMARTAKAQGVDPGQALTNYRVPGVVSTSPYFPAPSTDQAPLIGHMQKGKGGANYKFLGGQRGDQNNWGFQGGDNG